MNSIEANQLLAQMRSMAQQAGMELPAASGPGQDQEPKANFSDLLKDSINQVNELQQSATALKTAFERGDADVSLAEVMVASQKASLSFQAMTQVRNRLVSAYQDVMNMPI